jgi:hypothetical protein
MPTRHARLPAIALVLGSCFAGLSYAAPLPEGVANRATLSEADRTAVRTWANDIFESMRSGEPAAVSAARTTLIDALSKETSVAFRLEASGALAPALSQIARGGDETRAFNAFQAAGVLATEAGAEILRNALASQSPTVRYGGALGSRILFQQFVSGRSPLTAEAITQHMRALASALERESDPVVAEGLMTSFAVQFSTPGARASALRLMDDAVSKRVESLRRAGDTDPRWTRAVVRAVDSSRRLLLDQQVAGQRDEQFARAAATLAGNGLAFASARIADAQGTDRDVVGDLLKASEVTLLLSGQQLGARDIGNEQPIAQAWERSNDGAIRQAIDRWIGPSGLLYRAPFNLPAGSLSR